MQLIREIVAHRKGRAICDELKRRGHDVVGCKILEDGREIMVAVDIIPTGETWWKAITLPADSDPGAFERAFDRWRAKVRVDLFEGRPSAVVKQAIQRYGRAAVDEALKPKLAAFT
jgi:nucleoside-diphosphate-sugar epimerase